jgi:hypothetical protein
MVNNICNEFFLFFKDFVAQCFVLSSSTIGRQISAVRSDQICQIGGRPGSKISWPALAQTGPDHAQI